MKTAREIREEFKYSCLLKVQMLSHAVLLSWAVRNRIISGIYLFSCLKRIVWCWEYRKPQGCLTPVLFGDSALDFSFGLPNNLLSHCMVQLLNYLIWGHTHKLSEMSVCLTSFAWTQHIEVRHCLMVFWCGNVQAVLLLEFSEKI